MGITTAHFQLTVQPGNNRMEGTETWTWDGGLAGDCVDSGSLVVVNRVNPLPSRSTLRTISSEYKRA